MSEKPKIQQIPIDPNGRYVLVVRGLDTANFVPVMNCIRAWWQSGEPVLVISLAPDVDFKIVRVDNEQEPSQEWPPTP